MELNNNDGSVPSQGVAADEAASSDEKSLGLSLGDGGKKGPRTSAAENVDRHIKRAVADVAFGQAEAEKRLASLSDTLTTYRHLFDRAAEDLEGIEGAQAIRSAFLALQTQISNQVMQVRALRLKQPRMDSLFLREQTEGKGR